MAPDIVRTRAARIASRVAGGRAIVATLVGLAIALARPALGEEPAPAGPPAVGAPEASVPVPADGPAHPGAPPSTDGLPASETKAKLAEDFSDPLTTLPQVFFQDIYTPSNYGTDAQANRVLARVIVPRIPKFSLLPFVQLIRPSFSLVTIPKGRGRGTRTEFGDMQLFDLAVIPWPSHETGFYMAAGPVFVFPTATYETAGQGAWQVGPAFGAIYKGIPGLLVGGLIQNPISFAYTSDSRRPVSTLLIQPIFLAYIGHGFYVKSADSSFAVGWRRGEATTLPLSFGLGYVLLREGEPPLNFFVSGEWMAYRQFAPVAAQTTVRFGVTVAFPELSVW